MNGSKREALRLAIDARRRELEEAPADGIPHGTTTGYGRPYKCRCIPCRDASTAARKARRLIESKEERNVKEREYRKRRRKARMAEQ